MCRRRHGKRLVGSPVYISLSLCFESVFFVHGQSWWSLAEQYMVVCRTGINYIHESVYIHV
ncbi:unnamed protein product [Brassica oleracea]